MVYVKDDELLETWRQSETVQQVQTALKIGRQALINRVQILREHGFVLPRFGGASHIEVLQKWNNCKDVLELAVLVGGTVPEVRKIARLLRREYELKPLKSAVEIDCLKIARFQEEWEMSDCLYEFCDCTSMTERQATTLARQIRRLGVDLRRFRGVELLKPFIPGPQHIERECKSIFESWDDATRNKRLKDDRVRVDLLACGVIT